MTDARKAERVAVEKRVNEALLRWRSSVVPVEDPAVVGDRRARTLTTIAAAMRQGLLERERARVRRRWAYVAAAASALIGLSAAAYSVVGQHAAQVADLGQAGEGVTATLTGRGGKVWAGHASAEELVHQEPLGAGAMRQLSVGDRVVTHAGQAGLEVGGNTKVQLRQRSELVLAKNARDEKRLVLKRGAIDVAVKPQESASNHSGVPSRRSVVVQTPDAMVLVHGTRFTVSVDPAGPSAQKTVTTVRVTHGVVSVVQQGVERARLRAGQSWSSSPSSANLPTQPEPTAAAGSAASQPVSKSSKGSLRWNRAPSRATLAKRAPTDSLARRSAAEAGAPESEVVSSTLQEENRLFRLAVDARNRGDDAIAVRYFGQLLSQYPASALAQEAKVEQFRALKRLGRNRDAAREARRYLIEHGNGFAEEEARDVALMPDK